ncbi:putative RNA-directed DNA polymerase [Rosa chinensis]|uniref:Putative RNA-directed DNA polymerase n=1 Tax=Rosa chinensis TaxID=74649 RepID=A0A2P6RT72_ROSCH|nr:putative RNA-directed DNA polymerase [Rosa chinensis]
MLVKGQSSKVNDVQKVEVSVRSSDGGSFGDCGKIGMALNVSNFVGSDTWIIDSGASDHMTYDKSYFTDLSSPPVSYVTNANGEAFPVLGSGSVRVTPTLELHNVLYVPDLSHHLISVPQLNTESKCSVTFYPMYVIFQDLLTREIVGRGYLRVRLFHLDQTYAGEKPGAQSRVALTSNSDKISEIWLWHRHLGHHSFSLMKTTMPTLFIGVNESALRCETYVLAKSHRATYSPRVSNKSVIPFELIHSDVWGPSREPTVSGMRYNSSGENSFFEELYHGEGEESEGGEEASGILTDPVETISSSPAEAPNIQAPVSMAENDVEDTTPNIQAPVSMAENDVEDTTVPPTIASTPDPLLPGTEDHSFEVCPPTSTSSNESTVGQYVLPNRTTRGQSVKRYEPTLTAKSKYPVANYMSTRRLSKSYESFMNQISAVSVPNKVQDALGDPKWRKAMEEEMEALQKSNTWQLVPPPQGKKAVGCRWVFTVKHNADGSVNRYKARLVAKGFTQTYGIDYDETFAPVAKMNTIRVLLSFAASLNWPLRQFDVKNAFLHGELAEEVYMSLPLGYVVASPGDFVCRLRKSLYGLKQSPRAWFGRFSQFMRKVGYRQSNSDHTLFLKHQQGKVTALIIYVDDMIITGNDTVEIDRLQRQLAFEFEMKDLGELKYFLGIEVARGREGIYLCQRKYVLDLLTKTGLLDCRPVDTPIEQNHCLAEYPDQVPTDRARYQRLVGRLIYLAHTRPDVAYAVSVVSQFMHNPSESHMDAVMRILKYLKSAPGMGVLFSKHNNILDVCGFTDADWAGNITDRRSTSGYFTFVGGNLVTWKSKKQKVVARSSAEAEYRGMAQGVCELLWLRNLLRDLGFKLKSTMQLYCDNKAAIDISQNPVQHDRTKHVEVDRHFIKEKLDAKIISFPFVPTEEQLADVLTKGVSRKAFYDSLSKLGMVDVYAPT